jgi:hypothetical protein
VAGLEHGVVDAIGQVADDAVDVGCLGLEFGWGQWHVVVGRHDLDPGRQQWVGAASNQGAGDEDPSHQWVV